MRQKPLPSPRPPVHVSSSGLSLPIPGRSGCLLQRKIWQIFHWMPSLLDSHLPSGKRQIQSSISKANQSYKTRHQTRRCKLPQGPPMHVIKEGCGSCGCALVPEREVGIHSGSWGPAPTYSPHMRHEVENSLLGSCSCAPRCPFFFQLSSCSSACSSLKSYSPTAPNQAIKQSRQGILPPSVALQHFWLFQLKGNTLSKCCWLGRLPCNYFHVFN